MKDDISTPTPEGESPNTFERDKPGTADRSRAEAAIEQLRQRGGVFVDAVRATRMPMVLTDPNLPGNPIVFANEAFLGLSGYRMEEVLGQQPHFLNGPATDARDVARFTEAIRADQDDIIETVQYRRNGSRFTATVLVSAFKDDQRRTLNHFMSWLDVTRRVDAEEEVADLKRTQVALRDSERHANLLLAELQHRVRNTLAVVRSIAKRTADNSESAEDMLAHFQGRLDAFSRVQAALTRNAEGTVDLSTLIEDEMVAHATREGEHVQIDGEPIALSSKPAERLSLAMHELVTNAVKHGALSTPSGRIHIGWRTESNGDGERLSFQWKESGLRLAEGEPPREGFGMELLRRSLPYDLGAETELKLEKDGVRFELRMPLSGRA